MRKMDGNANFMSAPGKNKALDPDMYLGLGQRNASSSKGKAMGTTERDATSRFSSCTAKTSPSTDNNSSGYPTAQETWDPNLKAKICQQSNYNTSDD